MIASLLALPLVPVLTPLAAQDPSFHGHVRDQIDITSAVFSDVWGHKETGYIGRWTQSEIHLIDVSDPDNLSIRTMRNPGSTYRTKDPKVGASAVDPSRDLLFIGLEGDSTSAGIVYDVTDPDNPFFLSWIRSGFLFTCHNLSYRDDGWLAMTNGGGSVAIFDLTSYDPANPPTVLSNPLHAFQPGGNAHDITLTDEYLFISSWTSMKVYDATDLAGAGPVYLGETPGYANHANWPTSDYRYVVSTDERSQGSVLLYEMIDSGGSVIFYRRDSFTAPPTSPNTPHNVVFNGDRAYVSDYTAGVTVLQVDRSSNTWERVASVDTTAATGTGFSGCWGVYPLLGHDRVLASDISNGFFTLDFSALQFVWKTPRPDLLAAAVPNAIDVDIEELGNMTLDAATVTLHASVDGDAFVTFPMSNVGGNTWSGTLPSLGIGRRVEYYVSAAESGGEVFTTPASAPNATFRAFSAAIVTDVFVDDFSTDQGWTVTNDPSLSAGAWERAVPNGTGLAPEFDDDADPGDWCYVTQNAATVGASIGVDDVDGGPTILTSPALDFSAGDGLIEFSMWIAASQPDLVDHFVVELSNDNVNWVEAERFTLKCGGWLRHVLRVSDSVAPNGGVRVRFSIADVPNNTSVEAGLDNFRARRFDRTALAVLRNGSGTNATCFASSAPVIGTPWTSIVTHSGHPGATTTAMLLYSKGLNGPQLAGGQLLLDLSSSRLLQSLRPATGSADLHEFVLPSDPMLAGLTFSAQAAILGGQFALCNAYDYVIGF